MKMENYTPNSHKFKAEQKANDEKKKVEKVVKGKVRTKKKGELSKLSSIFISEDAANVKSYVFMDVLVPAIKKAVSDIVVDGINMILYGDTAAGRDKKRGRSGYVSYRDYYDGKGSERTRDRSVRTSRYDFDDIILDTRGEAEDVLTRMDELLEAYGIVSVADMYDLVGITCEYTDNKYGWTNLRNADVVRVRDGYMLKLPKALPIN